MLPIAEPLQVCLFFSLTLLSPTSTSHHPLPPITLSLPSPSPSHPPFLPSPSHHPPPLLPSPPIPLPSHHHPPLLTSFSSSIHFHHHYIISQEVVDGYFSKYDYGSAEANIAHYGTVSRIMSSVYFIFSFTHFPPPHLPHLPFFPPLPPTSAHKSTPPSYNVTELTVPTMLFTGGNDRLADPTDVAELIPKIKSVIIYDKNIPQYEHLDFLWGLDAATEVYDEAIAIMKQRL